MITLYNGQSNNILIKVTRGMTDALEDFSKSLLKVFLLGSTNRMPLTYTLSKDGITAVLPSSITPGVYGVKLVWTKNGGEVKNALIPRSVNYGYVENAFALTATQAEATQIAETDILVIKTQAVTYGYDGLDAYEIGVLRGTWIGDEASWLESKMGELIGTGQIANGAVIKEKISNQSVTMEKLGGDVTARLTQIEASVTAEAVARNGADSSLGASISQAVSRIGAEEIRAKAAEKANADAISAEVARAKAEESRMLYNVIQPADITNEQYWDEETKSIARNNIDAPTTSVATTSAKGLMSAADKAKLNNISIEGGRLKIECEDATLYFEPTTIITKSTNDTGGGAFPGGAE